MRSIGKPRRGKWLTNRVGRKDCATKPLPRHCYSVRGIAGQICRLLQSTVRLLGIFLLSKTVMLLCEGSPVEDGSKPHFGVLISLFERQEDPHYVVPCLLSLRSLVQQTYPLWTLIVGFDGLQGSKIGEAWSSIDRAGVDRSRIVAVAIDASARERNLYSRADLWNFAGVNAHNRELHIAYNLSAITHVTRLDDDDVWYPDHLQNLADVYSSEPDVMFAHTQALGYLEGPFPANQSPEYLNRAPSPCQLIHATASWSTRLQVFYLQESEQRKRPRYLKSCCGLSPCSSVLPADADMWDRIREMVELRAMKAVFIPKVDVSYSTREKKTCIYQYLQGKVSWGACFPTEITPIRPYRGCILPKLRAISYK